MIRASDEFVATTFRTRLGWMAVVGRGPLLRQLVMGRASPDAALRAIDHKSIALEGRLRIGTWDRQLVSRLKAYAEGTPDEFLDVPVEPFVTTEFAGRVIRCCRQIAYGTTISYGELARKARRTGAARAVGNLMAANRVPLVIPCHRVVHAGGGLGGFSAPTGVQLKRRLLELEAGQLPPLPTRSARNGAQGRLAPRRAAKAG